MESTFMRPGDLLALLNHRPFRPFRLLLSTGILHEIRHPELVIVARSTATLEFPEADQPLPLASRSVVVALLHIVQIEFLARPTPPPSN
jgi:hypothetical protein